MIASETVSTAMELFHRPVVSPGGKAILIAAA
jgi:hypothetical protein